MKRRKRAVPARRMPYVTPAVRPEAPAPPTPPNPAQMEFDEAQAGDAPPPRDYFPLSPMIAVAMLWWCMTQPIFFQPVTWMAIATIGTAGGAYVIYRWLCGPGQRAALLGVGLTLIFCFTWWRSVDPFQAVGLMGYFVMLILLWVMLKFAGRTHVRVIEEEQGPPRFLHDDPRGYLGGEIGDYWEYVPVLDHSDDTVEEVWTTVSTVFQPRFPASWSARTRRLRYWQGTFAGLALIILGLLAAKDLWLHLPFISLDGNELAILMIAAGCAVVTVLHELRRAAISRSAPNNSSTDGID
jgi:hypothetical protein